MATKTQNAVWNRDDRDLLIELRTEMKGVRDDIKALADGTSVTLADHETRLRAVEGSAASNKTELRNWGIAASLALAGLEAALRIFFR